MAIYTEVLQRNVLVLGGLYHGGEPPVGTSVLRTR